jgi:hypothetical protein
MHRNQIGRRAIKSEEIDRLLKEAANLIRNPGIARLSLTYIIHQITNNFNQCRNKRLITGMFPFRPYSVRFCPLPIIFNIGHEIGELVTKEKKRISIEDGSFPSVSGD